MLNPFYTQKRTPTRLFASAARLYKMGEILPEEAPFPLTAVDKWVLSQTDEEFHKHDWEELKEIIGRWL